MAGFAHLHVHTQYSLLTASIRSDQLLQKVADLGMQHVAVTDHGNLFGAVGFSKAAKKLNINPIIGCEVQVAPDEHRDKAGRAADRSYHLILLAEDAVGYRNLCTIISRGYMEGMHSGKPRVTRGILADHHQGIIALSSCIDGEIPWKLLQDDLNAARQAAMEYASIFKGTDGKPRFYLELQRHARHAAQQEKANQGMVDLGRQLGIPLVVTNNCHYLGPADARAHEVLLCIGMGKTLNSTDRLVYGDDYYLKSPAEMAALFPDYPEAVSVTEEIAGRCHFKFELGKYHFPVYTPPDNYDLVPYFEKFARDGLGERLKILSRGKPDVDNFCAPYFERLEVELKIIKQMGFAAYFLIVADFINYAKDKGIPVGPGRGSAAGSLVAYSMRITDVDPIAYDLLFERFLNPERVSMPDVDVDFCQERRQEVIHYVTQKYGGRARVSQIITFGKLQAKACIKDVGRAMDMAFGDVDRISKLVPNIINITLTDAITQEPRLKELMEKEERVFRLMTFAQALEGLARHHSIHAAGVVISDKDLVEYLPVASGAADEVVTQFDMKYVEEIGLVKFDFLGLKTLTQVQDCLRQVKRNFGLVIDMLLVDIEDKPTYELLSHGDTTGVFQLESSGMKDVVARLKPSVFPDVIALVALYRPGPLKSGMVQDFIDRKHGRQQVTYPHPLCEEILKDTYGVIVYQEQVMLIAQRLSGYSLGEADLLRRAMGKKKPEEMAKQATRFVSGARENGISEHQAMEIFKLMEKFAEYGFNKSHSAAYGFISYQTAYLKCHYRPELMASLMTIDATNTDKVLEYIADGRECAEPWGQVEVLRPDVNYSDRRFEALPPPPELVGGKGRGRQIRYGFCAVKSVGDGAIDAILEARKSKKFKGLYDFCERVDLRRVNRKVLENLVKSGAFDDFGHRAQLLAAIPHALEQGQAKARERASGQLSLLAGGKTAHPPLPDVPVVSDARRLEWEKEALGLYLSGHPMQADLERIRKVTGTTIRDLDGVAANVETTFAAMVSTCKEITTKKGDRMAFVTFEDMAGSVEATIFSDTFAEASPLLRDERSPVLLVTGTVERSEGEDEESGGAVKFMARKIVALHEVETRETRRVDIHVDSDGCTREQLTQLRQILDRHRGQVPAQIQMILAERGERLRTVLPLPPTLRLSPTPQLKGELEAILGERHVHFLAS